MIDVGLTAGVKTLWQKASLRDYTLKVEDQEFRVHKVVLAAVSDYFQAMLCDSYVESNADSVELKGLCADAVSKLLEFIYTGDETLLNKSEDAIEVLKCAMYLQISAVSEFCVKKLSENLSYENCVEILAVCMEYSFHKEVTKISNFMMSNWKKVFECYNPEELTAKEVQVLIENWQKSEWDLFLFINDWFSSDPESLKDDVNNLLNQVRFCIIPPKQVESVREMEIFCNTEGSWHDLVVKALEYHQMPMHLKVLDKSEQGNLRTGPSPVALSLKHSEITFEDPEDKTTFLSLDNKNHWRKHEIRGNESPKSDSECICLTVNNFLIVASFDKQQALHLFDPRTLTWSSMPKLPRAKVDYTLLYHNEHLYAIGGEYIHTRYDNAASPDAIEQYSFRSNTWTSFSTLPVEMFSSPAACMLGDRMYICGGRRADKGYAGVLYCLDLSTESPEWEEKSPGEWLSLSDQLCVVTIVDEQVLLLIHDCLKMSYYSPSQDNWTQLHSKYEPPFGIEQRYIEYSWKVTDGDSLYILNVEIVAEEYDSDDDDGYGCAYLSYNTVESLCWKWKIPQGEICDIKIEDFPYKECARAGPMYYGSCVGLLALPCEMFY